MKQKSVKDLYLVKQILAGYQDTGAKKAIQLINGVLLEEGGTNAVLYPYNDLKETILQLRGECMSPRAIAEKLGLGEDGEEVVLCVVEDPSNYEEERK